jgi:general secretion pathway protein K
VSRRPSRERGVALLTALLIVLALSSLAVAALEGIQRTRRLDANATSLAQARWYAIGAEAQVRAVAADFRKGGLGRLVFAKGPRVFTFPLEAGAMEIAVRDGSLCLNLNSVVVGAAEIHQRNETGVRQLTSLMTGLDVPAGQAAAAVESLVGWIDTADGRTSPDSDDARYLAQSPGYLTGGQPLVETSELRAIAGFTPEIYALIRPHVCALPVVGASRINLNALTTENAPVLSAVTGGVLPLKAAREIIAGRPSYGWDNVNAVQEAAQRAGYNLPERVMDEFELDPRYLDLSINVVHLDAEVALSEQLVLSGEVFRTAARRWSADP